MAIRAASHSSTNRLVYQMLVPFVREGNRILDFGAGRGHMCERLARFAESRNLSPAELLTACEVDPEVFDGPETVACHRIGLDSVLPFPDACFDVIYAIEVLEHTRRPYDLMDECWRALKEGGVLIFTLPNLMHIKSRLSLLASGFGEMYGPPSIAEKNAGRICGHIMPLSYPYLDYGLRMAGFEGIEVHVDRRKRSCLALFAMLYPFLKVGAWWYRNKLFRYDQEVWEENKDVVGVVNSLNLLTARSCVVSARKPGGANESRQEAQAASAGIPERAGPAVPE